MVVSSESEESDNEGDVVPPVVVMETSSLHPAADAPSLNKFNPWMSSAPEKRTPVYQKPQAVVNTQVDNVEKSEANTEDKDDSGSEQSQVDIDDLFDILKTQKEDRLKQEKEKSIKERLKMAKNVKQRIKDKQASRNKRRKEKKKKKETESDSEEESDESSEDEDDKKSKNKSVEKEEKREESLIRSSLKRKRTYDDMEEDWSDIEELVEKDKDESVIQRKQTQQSKTGDKKEGDKKDSDVKVDPKKVLTVEHHIRASHAPLMVEDEDVAEAERQHELTIAEAFATDDVVDEFSVEKKAIMERDKPKDIDLTLPGWGEWGGTNMKPSKKRRRK